VIGALATCFATCSLWCTSRERSPQQRRPRKLRLLRNLLALVYIARKVAAEAATAKMRPPPRTALAIAKRRSSMRLEVPNSLPSRWGNFRASLTANLVPTRKAVCSRAFVGRARSIAAASRHMLPKLPAWQPELLAHCSLLEVLDQRSARLITCFRRGITALIRRGQHRESLLR